MRTATESEHASNNCPNCGCRTAGPRLRICDDCKPLVARVEAKAAPGKWRMVWSGDPYWPAGGGFTDTDVAETLRMGNFPARAILRKENRWYQVRDAMRGRMREIGCQQLVEVNRARWGALVGNVRKRT